MPALLLRPVTRFVDSLCSIPATRVDTGVSSLPLLGATHNMITFPKYTPSHARPFSRRCIRCACEYFVIRQESRICLFCGESHDYEAQEDSPHRAHIRQFNTNASKRIVHFKNWIARLQGVEKCSITQEQISEIGTLVKTYPSNVPEYDRIKMAMKSLGLQKYYNHIYHVMRDLFGYGLTRFSKVAEARLVALFMRIQEPFSRIRSQRTNMLSYQFLIKKFCELLGYNVSYYIPHLKSRMNLQRQDLEWKQICEFLEVPFYPSV